jgi:streptogramin lyase
MGTKAERRRGFSAARKVMTVVLSVTLASIVLAPVRPVLAAVAPAVGTVTNYTNPGIDAPFRIALGPDRAMWYTNFGNNSIGRVSDDGTVTNYDGVGIQSPTDIVAGPDGALWFTNLRGNSIGRITVTGEVTNYTDPDGGIAEPYAIVVGPDGALWFTNRYGAPSIGRIDPVTKAVTHVHTGDVIPGDIAAEPDGALWFTGPLSFEQSTIWRMTTGGEITSFTDSDRLNAPEDITLGPDGALWFTQADASIGRITADGAITTYASGSGTATVGIAAGPDGALWYTFPGENKVGRMTIAGVATTFTGTGSSPQGITAGPDGDLWFTSYSDDRIGRMTTAGVVTDLFDGVGIRDPHAIALGSDGALWFTNHDNSSIGRVTTGGFVTTYIDPGINQPYDIVAGPDGALWFTNQGNNTIGRMTTAGVVANYTDGAISSPLDITVGPDGALWFTASNPGLGSIARMTVSGTVTSRTVGSSSTYDINGPRDIVAADGALWYVNMTSLGRITTDGVASHWYHNAFMLRLTVGPDGDLWGTTMIGDRLERISTDVTELTSGSNIPLGALQSEYSDPSMCGTREIAAGPDGTLWFTNAACNTIGRITTGGVASSYSGTGISTPEHITAGPDGALWFTNPGNNSIGRIESGIQAPQATTPSAPTMDTPSAGDGSVTLAWTAPSSDGGSPVSGYTVAYKTTTDSDWTTVQPDPATSLSMTISPLGNGTTYQFKVLATNVVGDSPASNEVSATPAAPLPGTLSITGPTSGRYGESVPIAVSGSSGTGALSFDAGTSNACGIDGGNVEISAGGGTCTITATRASDGTYASTTSDPFTVVIAKAPLTATAQDRSIIYGQATPSFAVNYAGFATGDSATSLGGSPSYTFAGNTGTAYGPSSTPPTHAGSYAITPSGLTSSNYEISFVAGTYTISPASVNTMLSWAGSVTPNPAVVGQEVSFPGLLSRTSGPAISDTTLTVALREWGDATCSYSSGYVVRDGQHIDASGQVTLHYTPSASSVGTHYFSLFFASQASGDSYYVQSSTSCLAVIVNAAKLDQTISFTAPEGVTYGDADLSLGATASSGLAVGYASSTPEFCTIVAGKLHVVAAGDCTVTASQAGSTSYNAAPDVARTFAVAKTPLTVTADADPSSAGVDHFVRPYGAANPAFTVRYAGFVKGETETVLGGELAFGTDAGATSPVGPYAVTPSGLTSSNYRIAFVGAVLDIGKAGQTVTFAALPNKTYGDADFDVSATASSGLTVAFAAAGQCSIAGITVHLTAAGSCTVTASQAGDANRDAATNVPRTFSIGKAAQSITFAAIPAKTYGDPDFAVSATATSGLIVGFATSGTCSIAGITVHLTAAGSCTVTASQAGDVNHSAATPVSRTFSIVAATGTVGYIGQTLYVTSGPNSTTAQVVLSASVVAAAGDIANARVTFIDDVSGAVLAKGVKVSPVAGSTTPTGTANAIVTLGSGKFGAQSYLLRVKLDAASGSSYQNVEQLADPDAAAYATLTVIVPAGTNTAKGDADLAPLAPAGVYASGTSVHYTLGLKYNKGGSSPQGQIFLTFDLGGTRYYVKSNSIISIACTRSGTPCRDLTIYTKASIYKVDALGQTTSLDGNATLRVDAHDAGGTTAGDTVGFTVLSSKSSTLYWSNNWSYDSTAKAWRTMQQSVTATGGVAVQIN